MRRCCVCATSSLPLLYLKNVLRLGGSDGQEGFVVVTQVGSQIFGIVVDGVFHTEEIVIKPMSSKLSHIAAFSGTTILGDGSVIMIIDPKGIAQALGRAVQSTRDDSSDQDDREETWADDVVSLLVFRAGSHQPKAVPLSLVTRLEEIDCRKIEISDGRHLVQYRDQLMPLLRIDTQSEPQAGGRAADPGLLRPRPFHGPRRRRDRRYRRGSAQHRSVERTAGRARLRGDQGQRHRDHRHRSFSAAGIRRLVPPPRVVDGPAAAQSSSGR